MKKKVLALFMVASLVLALVACGEPAATSTSTPTPTPTPTVAATPTTAPATPTPLPTDGSITFEDGSMSFVKTYMQHVTSDDSTLEIADFNGSKALKITKAEASKKPYVAIDVYSLFGDDAAKIAKMSMTIGTEYADGSFSATEGSVYFWTDTNVGKMAKETWSVYMKSKNPKVADIALPDGVSFGADVPVFLFSMDTDIGADNGHGSAMIYLDNICFYDASGNLLKPASTEVAFAAPDGFEAEEEESETVFKATASIEGFATKGTAWSQAGFDMPQEFIDALVPGTVLKFTYTSETDVLWIVLNGATSVSWTRCGDGTLAGAEHELAACDGNNCYITYEMLVNTYGEDKTAWGTSLQCESSGAWEVFSAEVGTLEEGGQTKFTTLASIDGFATKGTAWSQAGFDMPQEFIDALVPGTVLKFTYTSETDVLWIVLNGATSVSWTRCGDGTLAGAEHELADCDGSVCYITYEMLVNTYGEDKTAWGTSLQCESSGAWEVFSAEVGTLKTSGKTKFTATATIEGFATSGTAWSQAGFDMPQEFIDALVPGSVLKIDYTSETDVLWIVLNGATSVSWTRCGDGTLAGAEHELADCDGSVCYITYEMLVNTYGEDKTAWGTSLQCESSGAWEVFAVSVGTK